MYLLVITGKHGDCVLKWENRLSIAVETALG
jgi:hypothetical protein